MVRGPNKTLYAYEVCDAVEGEEFLIDGVAMSDFVYPAYFESFRKPTSIQFDHLKKINRPFQILEGGYAIVTKAGKVRGNIWLLVVYWSIYIKFGYDKLIFTDQIDDEKNVCHWFYWSNDYGIEFAI